MKMCLTAREIEEANQAYWTSPATQQRILEQSAQFQRVYWSVFERAWKTLQSNGYLPTPPDMKHPQAHVDGHDPILTGTVLNPGKPTGK